MINDQDTHISQPEVSNQNNTSDTKLLGWTQFVQEAVLLCVHTLSEQHPDIRVGLITFNHEVHTPSTVASIKLSPLFLSLKQTLLNNHECVIAALFWILNVCVAR